MIPLGMTLLFGVALSGVIAFVLMGLDKYRSRREGRRRIPEATLLLWCACLGGLGGWLGMQVFRHKTRHPRFSIGVPVMMLAQLALLALYFRYAIGGA